MQFNFKADRADAVFILKMVQEEHHAKEKSCIRFVDLEKAFDRIPKRVGMVN